MVEQSSSQMVGEADGKFVQQDDFFYKIICLSAKEFKIEVKSNRKSYLVRVDLAARTGFTGLPFEWERYFEELGIMEEKDYKLKIDKDPYEILLAVNFTATSGFSKMDNNKNLYKKMASICDNIKKGDPFKYFKKLFTLGEGGFGQVILCEHLKTKQHFAMKVIRPEDESDLEDTLTEIALQNMAGNENPMIIKIFQTFENNDTFYLLMEWMDAGDLSAMIKAMPGQIPEGAIKFIAKKILDSIHQMHQKNQIHRDLKPLNVMLTTNGDVKLGDFGLAAQLVVEAFDQKEIKGTPKWMAPEILMTKPYTVLVDIWSLGIICLELAEGLNPYRGMSLNHIMQQMKSGKPPKLRNKENKWSPEFLSFVNDKCLVKDTVKRADTQELLLHDWMKDADSEENQDAYLYFLTEYMNSELFRQKTAKFNRVR